MGEVIIIGKGGFFLKPTELCPCKNKNHSQWLVMLSAGVRAACSVLEGITMSFILTK
jgi:hypothetical protein